MKRCFCSFFVLLLLLSLWIPPVSGADEETGSRAPVYIGVGEVDLLADRVLAEIDTEGKTDREKIREVYIWVQENCVRDGWDGIGYFDEDEVAALAGGYEEKMKSEVDAGTASWRREYQAGTVEVGPGMALLSYDSNAYIATFAYEMFYTHAGTCSHFSSLLVVLLSHLGYDCRLIDGEFHNRDGSSYEHKWNCVLVDGAYFWLDARIDEAGYVRTGKPCFDYYMVSSMEEWAERHSWDHGYSDWLFANAGEIGEKTYVAMPWSRCSSWAEPYLTRAASAKLIPDVLHGKDMTAPISRAEFAASAVSMYQALGGTAAVVSGDSPFEDCADPDVLQAYALGIVQGVGEHRFAPDATLTREQAAAMLGRVWELISTGEVGSGETLAVSDEVFADQDEISDYARNYISFFAHHEILSGIGNGVFAPKTEMTREQALKVSAECMEKLG